MGDNVGAIVVSVVHATTEQHNYEFKKMPKRFFFSGLPLGKREGNLEEFL